MASTILKNHIVRWVYLLWSKNSIERLMISSSVIILFSSSATSPRSSLDPFEAAVKKKKKAHNAKWKLPPTHKNHIFLIFTMVTKWKFNQSIDRCSLILTIYRMLCIKVSSPLHFTWGHPERRGITSVSIFRLRTNINFRQLIFYDPTFDDAPWFAAINLNTTTKVSGMD